MHIDKAVTKCIRYARKDYPRELRSHMGAAIASSWQGYLRSWNKPFRRLFCGGVTSHFWVIKQAEGYRKGQKVFEPREARRILDGGGRLRDIRTPRSKELRGELSEIAALLRVHHDIQHGFVAERNCVEAAARHARASVVLTMDVENAFEQVRYEDAVAILHGIYDVNWEASRQIAEVSCHHRRLYQGSPIAPAIFNARAYAAAVRLQALAQANGLVVTMYADDVCISSESWDYISKGFVKTVKRIFAEEGLRVSPKKTHVTRPRPENVGATAITGLTIDYDSGGSHVRPQHRGRMAKKAEYLFRTLDRGKEYSRETAKDGHLKKLEWVIDGIEGWVAVKQRPPARQMTLCIRA